MTVAVDIDETIGSIRHVLDRRFRKTDRSSYDYEGDVAGFFDRHPLVYLHAVPYAGRADKIRAMARTGKLVYITRRNPNSLFVTMLWLLLNRFPLRKVYFTDDKGKLAESLGVGLAIDDSPEDILSYNRHGIPCGIVRKPYNETGFVPGMYGNAFIW